MTTSCQKTDDFIGQKIFVLPPTIRQELEKHPIGNLLYITDIGFFPKAKYHKRVRELGAEEHILIFCIEGKGLIKIDETNITLNANEYCLIPKEIPHSYQADSAHPWSIYWIHFNGTKANDINQYIPLHKSISLRSSEHIGRVGMFQDFFQILEKGITSENVLYISMQLWSLLSSFAFTSLYVNSPKKEQTRIEIAFNFMKNNLLRIITLDDIAQKVNVSASHFSKTFKDYTGYSPLNYFILLKMQEASRLLSLSNMSIKEIAFHLGYTDPYYFSRIFKKTIGRSPRDYRSDNM